MPKVSILFMWVFSTNYWLIIFKRFFFFLKNCNKLFECLIAYLISRTNRIANEQKPNNKFVFGANLDFIDYIQTIFKFRVYSK